MQVASRGRQIGVTEQFLNRPDVDATADQMGGEGVAEAVRDVAIQEMREAEFPKIETGAIALSVEFIMPRPKGYYWKGPHAEPRCCRGLDLGNLTKALEESLNGVLWRDDVQVSDYGPTFRRRYARPGEVCGAHVTVEALGEWEEVVSAPAVAVGGGLWEEEAEDG